jgi:hypothetical protein
MPEQFSQVLKECLQEALRPWAESHPETEMPIPETLVAGLRESDVDLLRERFGGPVELRPFLEEWVSLYVNTNLRLMGNTSFTLSKEAKRSTANAARKMVRDTESMARKLNLPVPLLILLMARAWQAEHLNEGLWPAFAPKFLKEREEALESRMKQYREAIGLLTHALEVAGETNDEGIRILPDTKESSEDFVDQLIGRKLRDRDLAEKIREIAGLLEEAGRTGDMAVLTSGWHQEVAGSDVGSFPLRSGSLSGHVQTAFEMVKELIAQNWESRGGEQEAWQIFYAWGIEVNTDTLRQRRNRQRKGEA